MNIFEKYEELAVRVECNGISGSGCLFQPYTKDFLYVLSAKHCLEGYGDNKKPYTMKDIVIKRFNGNDEQNLLKVIDFYEHDKLDLVVILVEYFPLLTPTLISIPSLNSSLGIYGYPHILNTKMSEEKRQRLSSKITYISKEIIEFTPEMSMDSYDQDAAANIRGFSGAGLYVEHFDNLFLVGIFTDLKVKGGTYNCLQALKISNVNDILKEKGLPELFPGDLLSFENYIETAFNRIEGLTKQFLKKSAKNLLDLNPKILVDNLRHKIFLPYNESYEMEIINSNLWEGWITLLTYLYLDTNNIPNMNDFRLVREKDETLQNIKMFFSNEATLSECVMNLYYEVYHDLNKNDLIVINMNGKTPPRKSYNQAKIKNKILKQIDRAKLYERDIDIDDPDYHKGIECIHIDLFLDEFYKLDDLESPSEIQKEVKRSITEVFNNVP